MSDLLNPNNLYFFDTNAIYYYCGENAGKYNFKEYREDFYKIHNKIMPSCVFQEILVKHRKDTDYLGKILTHLAASNFTISPSQYDNLGTTFLNKMLENLPKSIEEQFLKKIDNESRLIYVICFAVSMVFFNIIAKEEKITNIETFNARFVKTVLNPKEDGTLKSINSRLKEAYEKDDAEREVKRIYNDICFEYSYSAKYCVYIEKNKSLFSNKEDFENHFRQEQSTIKFEEYSDKYNEYWNLLKKSTNKTIIQEGLDATKDFFKTHKYTEEQVNYLKAIMEKLFLCKAKLEKNDIYDVLFLFSYSEYCAQSFNLFSKGANATKNNIILLSFDKKMKDYIKTFSPISSDIIDSYKTP